MLSVTAVYNGPQENQNFPNSNFKRFVRSHETDVIVVRNINLSISLMSKVLQYFYQLLGSMHPDRQFGKWSKRLAEWDRKISQRRKGWTWKFTITVLCPWKTSRLAQCISSKIARIFGLSNLHFGWNAIQPFGSLDGKFQILIFLKNSLNPDSRHCVHGTCCAARYCADWLPCFVAKMAKKCEGRKNTHFPC